MSQKPYRRAQVLVDARFQARYVALVAGVALVILAVLGVMYFRALAEQRDLMGLAGAGLEGAAAFDADLRDRAATDDRATMLVLAGAAAVMTAFLAFLAMWSSFRAAGPVRAAAAILKDLARGRLESVRSFRRHDDFRFLEEALFELRDAMRRDAEDHADLLERASVHCGDPIVGVELAEAARAKREQVGRTGLTAGAA